MARRIGRTGNAARQAIAVLLVFALTGCELTQEWLTGRPAATPIEVDSGELPGSGYLGELQQLASGDPATQAEIFADAESAARITPGPSTRLRYALVLATPGHAEFDDAAAQSVLREILAQPELLTREELALATIHLQAADSRLVLDAEARRLRSENERAASTEQAALARRIATVEAENRRLSESLADAEAKLEALSPIERSIREQAGNNPAQ